MTIRKKTILDKIGLLIPGFTGYATRSDKRNSDKRFREQNSLLISKSEISVVEFQKVLLVKNKIELMRDWELVRKKLNTLSSILKYSSYGESSFFSENQIKEIELDQIMEFDERISHRVQLIFNATKDELEGVSSSAFLITCIKQIESDLAERSTFISKYK